MMYVLICVVLMLEKQSCQLIHVADFQLIHVADFSETLAEECHSDLSLYIQCDIDQLWDGIVKCR